METNKKHSSGMTMKLKTAVDRYITGNSSEWNGWEFIHMKDLAIDLISQRVILDDAVTDYLTHLGFKKQTLSLAGYYPKPQQALARPSRRPEVTKVIYVTHHPTYGELSGIHYRAIMQNMIDDGVIRVDTTGTRIFTHKDINGYLQHYRCPGVIRKQFIKRITKSATKHIGVNLLFANHHNPITYYTMEDWK